MAKKKKKTLHSRKMGASKSTARKVKGTRKKSKQIDNTMISAFEDDRELSASTAQPKQPGLARPNVDLSGLDVSGGPFPLGGSPVRPHRGRS